MSACGELTGQQGVILAPPQGMDLCQQKMGTAPSERQCGASGSQKHMRPLKHSCSGTLREDGGRASGGRWDPRAHTVWNTPPPSFPGAPPLFSGKLPPTLGLAPPLGFPHPGPDRSGPSLEADLSPALTVSTEGAVSKQMLMPRLSGQSGLESATASGLQGQSGPQPDFPGGAVVKDLPASVGDVGSIPGSGRPPEKRNG